MSRVAVYPGTFDPITNGHLDILERASLLFDYVILAIAADNYKNTLFTLEERLDLAAKVSENLPNVRIATFDGLLVDFCVDNQATTIIRGLRALSDFEKEFQMALMNKGVQPSVESVFLMTAPEYQFVSSSMVKNFAALGHITADLIPPVVQEALITKFNAI